MAGKGGVGKTTVSAALARAAAQAGLSTLIVEVEGKSGLAGLFHQPPFDYEEVTLAPGGGPTGAADVRARTLTPDDALLEYLEGHGMSRISRRLASSGAMDVVATAAPGIKDILILGKVKQLERRKAHGPDRARRARGRPRHHVPALGALRCSTPCTSARSTPRRRTCSRC